MAKRYGRGIEIQRAIKAEFAAVEPSIEENMVETTAMSYGEEQLEIEMEYAAYREAARIYPLLIADAKTPIRWWRGQQRTSFNWLVYVELCKLWDTRQKSHGTRFHDNPQNDIEEPMEFLDDWSGPAMPMHAVKHL